MKPEQAKALRAPFPPESIGKLPRGGVMLDFVGHAAATDRLLQVDPEWCWEPFALDERGLPALDAEGNLWIRLTIAGVTRPGVGDGKNAKERISDAIRNAAMRFGVALDLWAKEPLEGGDDLGAGTAKKAAPAKPKKPAEVEKTSAGGDGGAAELPEPPPHPLVAKIEAEYGGTMTENQRKAVDAHMWDEAWLTKALDAVKKAKESSFQAPIGSGA